MKKLNLVFKSILLLGVGYSGVLSATAAEPVDSMKLNSAGVDEVFKFQNLKSIQSLSRECAYTESDKSCISLFASGADSHKLDSAMGGLLLAFSPSNNFRLGASIEQTQNSQGTLGGVALKRGEPSYGVFAMWSQNPVGSGLRVRAAANVSNVFIESTRIESGVPNTGLSDIQSKSFQLDLLKDYAFASNWVITPFVGYRELSNKRLAYDEFLGAFNSSNPLAYSELKQNIQSVSLGATLGLKIGSNTKLSLTAGMSEDFRNRIDDYSATSTRNPITKHGIERGEVPKQKINTLTFSMNHKISNSSAIGFSLNQQKLDRSSYDMFTGTIQFSRGF